MGRNYQDKTILYVLFHVILIQTKTVGEKVETEKCQAICLTPKYLWGDHNGNEIKILDLEADQESKSTLFLG